MMLSNKECDMRIEVGTIKLLSRVVLAVSGVIVSVGFFDEIMHHDASEIFLSRGAHACILYGLTLLAFAAMPATRRSDIAKTVTLFAVLIQLGRRLAGFECDILEVPCDALGAYAVFTASCVERLRALNRTDPHEPFSLVYPNDRRRQSRSAVRTAKVV